MSQVAQSLRFLHLNKIVHLDLKPENILFMKNYSIKLIDFGESFHPLVAYGGNFLFNIRFTASLYLSIRLPINRSIKFNIL